MMRLMTVLVVVLGLLALIMSGCGTQEQAQPPDVSQTGVEDVEKEAEEALEAAKEEAQQVEKKAEEEAEKAKDAAKNLLGE